MGRSGLHPRLARLPVRRIAGVDVPVATDLRARMLGLALIELRRAGNGLLIPGCAAVHTWGMRFPLDLVLLDHRGRPVAVHHSVAPFRFVRDPHAEAVLELVPPTNRLLQPWDA